MRGRLAALCLALLTTLPAAAQEGEDLIEAFARSGRFEELERALRALEAAHPGLFELEEYGRSRGGLPLLAARHVGAPDAAPDGERRSGPAVLVIAGMSSGGAAEATIGLRLLRQLARRARDPEAGGRPATLVVVCAPAPDRLAGYAQGQPGEAGEASEERAGTNGGAEPSGDAAGAEGARAGPPPRRVELDRDFPVAWQPGPGTAAWPLHEPESAALARWLLSRRDLAAALVLGAADPFVEDAAAGGLPGATPEPEERRLLGRLAGVRRRGPAPGPGSLAAFLVGRAGLFTVGLEDLGAGPAADAALELAAAQPELALGAPRIERLDAELVQLDLDLRNVGALPTATARSRALGVAGALRLELAGARAFAAAERRAPGGSFEALALRPGVVELDAFSGGEARTLRLLLEAAPGARLALALDGPRLARVELSLELP